MSYQPHPQFCAGNRGQRKHHVRFAMEEGMACISVTDNGKGVEGADIERTFEPYYSTKKLGIGLGLG